MVVVVVVVVVVTAVVVMVVVVVVVVVMVVEWSVSFAHWQCEKLAKPLRFVQILK